MSTKIKYLLLLGAILLLAGCIPTPATPTTEPIVIPYGGENTSTPIPLVVYVTATPFPPSDSTVNPTPVAPYTTPTPVPSNASITVTQVEDIGGGHAIVHWTTTGSFPSGYIIVWSSTNQGPTYPADQSNYSTDPYARSALITAQMGKIYYLRVCRLVNNTCDVYSNLAIFALSKLPTSTPVWSTYSPYYYPTATPISTSYNSSGTPVASTSGITITGMSDAGSGKARINWSAYGTFSSGFDIVYSSSYNLPYVGGYLYYIVSDGTARSAYVDGTPGTTYYYRICRRTGTTCDIYSNTYAFLYPGTAPTDVPTATATGSATPSTTPSPTPSPTPSATPDGSTITISDVHDTGSGTASVTWTTPTGVFPDGYKVLLSTTNPPTDVVATIADEATKTASISGIPGTAYYVQICKVSGSTCSSVVSSAFPFTFGQIAIDSVTDVSRESASVAWTPDGTFTYTHNFAVLYSDSVATPTQGTSGVLISSLNLTSPQTISGLTPGTAYHFRVCELNTSDVCVIYSPVADFTTGDITIDSIVDVSSGSASLSFTPAGGPFADYRVLYSDTVASPTLGAVGVLPPVSATSSPVAITGATAGTTYHFTVCAYSGSACTVYSPVVDFTFAQITSLAAVDGSPEGKGDLSWTPAGAFPDGYLYLISTETAEPTIEDYPTTTFGLLTSSPTATSGTIDITPGQTYYIRICEKAHSSDTCLVYSNTVHITFASSLVLGISGTGSDVTLTWTGPTSTTYSSYNVYRATASTGPFAQISNVPSGTHTADDTGISPAGTYYYQVCSFQTPNCTTYSNVVNYTVP